MEEDTKVISISPSRADNLTHEEREFFHERGVSPEVVNEFPKGTDLSAIMQTVRDRAAKAQEGGVMLQNPRPVMTPMNSDGQRAWGGGGANPDLQIEQLY